MSFKGDFKLNFRGPELLSATRAESIAANIEFAQETVVEARKAPPMKLDGSGLGVPVDEGTLKRATGWGVFGQSGQLSELKSGATVIDPSPQVAGTPGGTAVATSDGKGGFVHEGTRRMRGRPFIRNAVERMAAGPVPERVIKGMEANIAGRMGDQ